MLFRSRYDDAGSGSAAGEVGPATPAVRIQLAERVVLALPARALQREAGRNVVMVLANGQAEPREVRVGWRDGPWVEVVDGLNTGDRVLVQIRGSTETTP